MTLNTPLRFYGTHASPYTRKMLALLRYRHIPYRFIQGGTGGAPKELPEPRVNLLPIFYLDGEDGEVEAAVDSTPLIRRFEKTFETRSVIPLDPALRFIDYLLEDYGDEWLTKAMFHYRWAYERDAEQASGILQMEHNPCLPEEDLDLLKKQFSERQISRLYVVGSNDTTATVIENSYKRFLLAFNQILEQRSFLAGRRPGAADFAIYGQLTQLAGFDPTPMALTLESAPRVFAWVRYMDDLSGLEVSEDDWISRDELLQSLKPLLGEVGRTYVPVMLANARALASGEEWVETTVEGLPWKQRPFPYQGRCVKWIREQYLILTDDERRCIDHVLEGTGCENLLHD